jgi:hypothetical protein
MEAAHGDPADGAEEGDFLFNLKDLEFVSGVDVEVGSDVMDDLANGACNVDEDEAFVGLLKQALHEVEPSPPRGVGPVSPLGTLACTLPDTSLPRQQFFQNWIPPSFDTTLWDISKPTHELVEAVFRHVSNLRPCGKRGWSACLWCGCAIMCAMSEPHQQCYKQGAKNAERTAAHFNQVFKNNHIRAICIVQQPDKPGSETRRLRPPQMILQRADGWFVFILPYNHYHSRLCDLHRDASQPKLCHEPRGAASCGSSPACVATTTAVTSVTVASSSTCTTAISGGDAAVATAAAAAAAALSVVKRTCERYELTPVHTLAVGKRQPPLVVAALARPMVQTSNTPTTVSVLNAPPPRPASNGPPRFLREVRERHLAHMQTSHAHIPPVQTSPPPTLCGQTSKGGGSGGGGSAAVWSCTQCTLINQAEVDRCAMCNSRRAGRHSMPSICTSPSRSTTCSTLVPQLQASPPSRGTSARRPNRRPKAFNSSSHSVVRSLHSEKESVVITHQKTGISASFSMAEIKARDASARMAARNHQVATEYANQPLSRLVEVIAPTSRSARAGAAVAQLLDHKSFTADGVRWVRHGMVRGNELTVGDTTLLAYGTYRFTEAEQHSTKTQLDNTLMIEKEQFAVLLSKAAQLKEAEGLDIDNLPSERPGAAFIIGATYILKEMQRMESERQAREGGWDDEGDEPPPMVPLVDAHTPNTASKHGAFSWHVDDHAPEWIETTYAAQCSQGSASIGVAGVGEHTFGGQGGIVRFGGYLLHRTKKVQPKTRHGSMWKLVGFFGLLPCERSGKRQRVNFAPVPARDMADSMCCKGHPMAKVIYGNEVEVGALWNSEGLRCDMCEQFFVEGDVIWSCAPCDIDVHACCLSRPGSACSSC